MLSRWEAHLGSTRQKKHKPFIERVADALSLSSANRSEITPDYFPGKTIDCFLCGGRVEIKLTKKRRPYFHCLRCYLQCFVRGDEGIQRLAKLIEGGHE